MGLSPTIVPGTSAQAANSPAISPAEGSGNALTSDFETFLRLLTAQLSNQDPLKPMESTEFVSQLASFSAVEQQTRTNTLLEQMIADLSGQGSSGLAQWIGRNVGIAGPVDFDGVTSVDLRLSPLADATSARLDIYDDFGTLVGSQDVDPLAADTTWNGILPAGTTAAAGRYRFEVSYFRDGVLMSQQDALSPGIISELRFDPAGSPVLRLQDGREIDPDAVLALFQADTTT